ncbi:MAG: TlpA disulfide reductase family protein [Planctomycetota bacterium]|nr:TlpA disulfide reductase family protein [Planctomycetota bacterium]
MPRRHTTLILAALLATASHAAAQQDTNILREATGDRAATLTEMEMQPFDSTLWSLLDNWTNGDALDAAATEGRVVLVMTWATWNPASTRVLPMVQKLKETYEDDGLLIVGVHHQQGWDNAEQTLTQRRSDILAAHDAEGEFRDAIHADQDPDFYVIDRAGQLRFADIRTESVQSAVKMLLAEDVSAASSINARLAAQAAKADAALRKPRTIQGGLDMRAMPEVPFPPPSETLYARADWPKPRKDDNNSNRNDDGPSAYPVPESGWISGVKPKTDGRAVVYYAWRLDDPRSAEIARRMERLQTQLGRDVVIAGVCTGVQSKDRSSRNDQQIEAEVFLSRIERFRRSHGLTHPMLADLGGNLFNNNNNRGSDEDYVALVVSSDSISRWDGVVADPAFRSALDRVIDVDPGVQARRAAEQAFIRARGG